MILRRRAERAPGGGCVRHDRFAALLLAAAVLFPAQAGGDEDREALPDLEPMADALAGYFVTRENHCRLLRFETAIANVGAGPIEVRGTREGARMIARQRIFRPNGKIARDRRIGYFKYHDPHRHWHLMHVARYTLLDQSGEVVGMSDKVSFCLMDTDHVFPDLPGSPADRKYGPCPKRRSVKRLKAGISVGWQDIYDADLPGQYVDVTGLPAGEYTLRCEVDPNRRLTEKSRANNRAEVTVHLE
jgi:hypothetical protein